MIALRGNVTVDYLVNDIVSDPPDVLRDVLCFHQLTALLINMFPLIVGDIVELEQLLAHIEIASFDLPLRILDGFGDPRVLDGLAFLHAEFLHQAGDTLGSEDSHQAIFQRQIEPA